MKTNWACSQPENIVSSKEDVMFAVGGSGNMNIFPGRMENLGVLRNQETSSQAEWTT
jgi:hypothetical protein